MLRQSVLTTYRNHRLCLQGTLAFDIASGYRLDYRATWQRQRSTSPQHTFTFDELSQRAELSLRLYSSRLFLSLHASHTHNSELDLRT